VKVEARERRRKLILDQIVGEALEILATDGYDALTIAHLAGKLGYAVGALYRYFPSKDALFVHVQSKVLETARADLLATLARVDDGLERARSVDAKQATLVRIFAAALAHGQLASKRPAFFALLAISVSDPRTLVSTEVGKAMLPALSALSAEFARILDEAVKAGALAAGDSLRRAVIFWGAHQGILSMRKLSRFGAAALDAEMMTFDLIAPLLVGWGADEKPLKDLYRRAEKLTAE
jgi:AcrR family transcriptional regulator